MNVKLSFADRQRRISELAHRIWESEGRPPGHSLRHWLMAEKLVTAHERGEQENVVEKHADAAHAGTPNAGKGSSGHG